MSNPYPFSQPDQFAVPLSCPKCGQRGVAIVERTLHQPGNHSEYVLVSLPVVFYQRLANPRLDRIETACHICDGLLPTGLYDSEAPVFAGAVAHS